MDRRSKRPTSTYAEPIAACLDPSAIDAASSIGSAQLQKGPMYRMHRWFEVAAGQGAAAREYLSRMTAYLRDGHGVTAEGFIEVFGPQSASCHLMIDFDDLVDFESWWNGLASDADFGKLHAVESAISIEGTTNQALLHSHTS